MDSKHTANLEAEWGGVEVGSETSVSVYTWDQAVI